MANPESMNILHQPPASFAWTLEPATAVTLAAQPRARGLWVHEGRVWLTRRRGSAMEEDIWLDAGQGLTLEAGTDWVAEGWPQARLSVLQAPPRPLRDDRPAALGARLRALLPRPVRAGGAA